MYHFTPLAFINTYSGLPLSNTSMQNWWHYPAANRSSPSFTGWKTQARLALLQCNHPNAPNHCLDCRDLFSYIGPARKTKPEEKVLQHRKIKSTQSTQRWLIWSSKNLQCRLFHPPTQSLPNRKPVSPSFLHLVKSSDEWCPITSSMGAYSISAKPPAGMSSRGRGIRLTSQPHQLWHFQTWVSVCSQGFGAHPLVEHSHTGMGNVEK